MNIIKDVLFWIFIGLVVLFGTIFLSNLVFGDVTNEDTFTPLWIILPVFAGVLFALIYFSNKASKK